MIQFPPSLPLFDLAPAARRTDPDTSQSAASRDPSARHIDRQRALQAHREHPKGLTDFELADLLGRQQTSAGKRRGELRDAGLVEDSGVRRPSPSGASAVVWKVTDAGRGQS